MRRKLDDLGRVNIRELDQVCQVTHIDVAKGIHLGPQAHVVLFREAERRIAQLRGSLTPIAYDRLRTMLLKLRRVLTDRVNYFALKGRYRAAQPAS